MTLIGLSDFWDNISSIFLGFLDLFSALPDESTQSVFEVTGIVHLLGAFIFCIYIVGTIVLILSGLKERAIFRKYGVLLYCASFNIIMFIVVNVKDGASVFQVRYLLPVFLFLTIIVGAFIERLSDSLLFKKCGMVCTICILLMLDVYGDRKYIRNRHDYDTLFCVTEEVKKLDVPVIYVYGGDMKLESRALGVMDSSRIYKYIYPNCFNFTTHWGDYTNYDDVAEVQGKNVLISEPEKFANMPEYIRNQYQLYKQIGRYYIYYAETNKFDFLSGVSGGYSVDYPTSFGINILNGLLDGNGALLSDGGEGELIEGPFTEIDKGIYDFILNYEIMESGTDMARFSVSVNYNNDILGKVCLPAESVRACIDNIEIKEKSNGFSYNIYNTNGTKIKVNSFEIYKVE